GACRRGRPQQRSCSGDGRPSLPSFPRALELVELQAHVHERRDQDDGPYPDEDDRGELHANSSCRGFSRDTFCSSSSASRSFFVSFFGTLNRSRAIKSPLPLPFSLGAPWPRMRSCRPSCVPAGTLRDTRPPYGVGTSTLAPSAASVYVTGTSTTRSLSRRWNSFDGCTLVTTKRSPAGPPCSPSSPLPLRRMRVPSFTPAGILTVYVLVRTSRPVPWQLWHGFSMTVPLPRQRGHGSDRANSPWLSETTPRPLHTGQMTGDVPGSAPVPPQTRQAVATSTGIFTSRPRSESSNDTLTGASRSAPRSGCARRAPPRPARPPKSPPNRSPRSPRSLIVKLPPPKLPGSKPGPARR